MYLLELLISYSSGCHYNTLVKECLSWLPCACSRKEASKVQNGIEGLEYEANTAYTRRYN